MNVFPTRVVQEKKGGRESLFDNAWLRCCRRSHAHYFSSHILRAGLSIDLLRMDLVRAWLCSSGIPSRYVRGGLTSWPTARVQRGDSATACCASIEDHEALLPPLLHTSSKGQPRPLQCFLPMGEALVNRARALTLRLLRSRLTNNIGGEWWS